MKLWSGRFSADTDALVDELNASLPFDRRLYKEDIEGSIAHADMLAAQGVIDRAEADLIIATLGDILKDIEAGNFEFKLADEDIHMSIEAELTRRIGDAGKRLHTARSRNDQVARPRLTSSAASRTSTGRFYTSFGRCTKLPPPPPTPSCPPTPTCSGHSPRPLPTI